MMIRTTACIFHVDADSFFASVEVAKNPALSDKPVCVMAGSRGCILAATYGAKSLGIKTGMPYWEAIKLLPASKAHYVTTHFRDYAQYSELMFSILRSFSPQVEEMSVDEGYLDMTGLRKMYRKSYRDIALMIQERIKRELGLPVSIGIGPTKTLAKIASKKAKPYGVYRVPTNDKVALISTLKYADIPGIGRNSAALLNKYGLPTPLDFIRSDEGFIGKLLGSPGGVLWRELQGELMSPVTFVRDRPKSLSRIRSFSVTNNLEFLQSELIHHVLLCTYKLRKKGLIAKRFSFYLRSHVYEYIGKEYEENMPHHNAFKFLGSALPDFLRLALGVKARSVGVVFSDLLSSGARQPSLFVEENTLFRQEDLLKAADQINDKFGKNTVLLASLDPKKFVKEPWTVEMLTLPYLGGVA